MPREDRETLSASLRERIFRVLPPKWTVGVGAIVLAAAAGERYWNGLDGDGRVEAYGPHVQITPEIDNYTNGASWNVKNRIQKLTPQIDDMIERNKLDFFSFQEGTVSDARFLSRHYPEWHVLYMPTDGKQDFEQDGAALIIMSRQEISEEDREGETFKGTSLVETAVRAGKAVLTDGVDTALAAEPKTKNLVESFQETRGIMAVTIKVQIGDQLEDVRVVNLHNTPYRSEQQQITQKMLEFIGRQHKPGRPMIVCGDFNQTYYQMVPKMAELKLITVPTAETSDSKKVIDMCFQYTASGKLGPAEIKTLTHVKGSDHRPVVFRSRSEPSKE